MYINKRKIKDTVSKLLVGVLIVGALGGLLFCGQGLFMDYLKYKTTVDTNKEISDLFHSNDADAPEYSISAKHDVPFDESGYLMGKYNIMKNQNPDYACWLKISGLNLELPVCVNPDSDSFFYLTHDFRRNWVESGCLFIDPGSDVDCDNLVIYGHHMYNGTMFGSLKKFQDQDWARENRVIEVYTATEHRYYEVVSVFTASLSNMPYAITGYTVQDNQDISREFAWKVRNATQVDMDWIEQDGEEVYNPNALVPGVFQERYLTLITCEYTHNNGRLVVVAREIDRPIWE